MRDDVCVDVGAEFGGEEVEVREEGCEIGWLELGFGVLCGLFARVLVLKGFVCGPSWSIVSLRV